MRTTTSDLYTAYAYHTLERRDQDFWMLDFIRLTLLILFSITLFLLVFSTLFTFCITALHIRGSSCSCGRSIEHITAV